MPQLWIEQDGQWNPIVVNDSAAPFSLRREPAGLFGDDEILLVKADGARTDWALLTNLTPNSPVRVNGESLTLGIRVLHDRDAMQLGGEAPIFFSTESTPVIAPFAGEKPLPCARCRSNVLPGSPAVQCPRCGAVHHEHAEDQLACWSYAERCGRCNQQLTSLDAENAWTPAEL